MHTAIGNVSCVVPVMAGQVKSIAEEIPALSERIAAMQEDLRVSYASSTFVSGLSIGADR